MACMDKVHSKSLPGVGRHSTSSLQLTCSSAFAPTCSKLVNKELVLCDTSQRQERSRHKAVDGHDRKVLVGKRRSFNVHWMPFTRASWWYDLQPNTVETLGNMVASRKAVGRHMQRTKLGLLGGLYMVRDVGIPHMVMLATWKHARCTIPMRQVCLVFQQDVTSDVTVPRIMGNSVSGQSCYSQLPETLRRAAANQR